MVIKTSKFQDSSEGNALGSSLETLRSSGDYIFGKIYKMQIPKSSNAISTSLGISKTSRREITEKISKTSKVMKSSLEALKASGKQIFEKFPKMATSDNAVGSSLESLHASGRQIFEKISKTDNK